MSKQPAILLLGLHSYIYIYIWCASYTFHCVRISLRWARSYFWRPCILFLRHDWQMLATHLHSNDFSSTREKMCSWTYWKMICSYFSLYEWFKDSFGLIVTRAIHQLFPVFFLVWLHFPDPLRLGRALWLPLVIELWTQVRSMKCGRKL